MKTPKISIDFNEMVTNRLVLLSKTDLVKDANGNTIELKEGMKICVYMEDKNGFGEQDNLMAFGTVELNKTGVFNICKWNCRIDENGIRHKSDW